jgi:beta-glucosidase/6-phospho-beta-glucosidase/beta-galactosidase
MTKEKLKPQGRIAKTWEETCIEFVERHGDRYEYDSSSYVNQKKPMRMKCSEHGWFKRVPRYDKTMEWELSRFCNKLDTSIVGGASKLLKHFIKEHNPQTIISYADRRWSDGGLYDTLGFDYYRTSMARYFYMSKKNYLVREHRSNYTKDRIKAKFSDHDLDMNLTEWELMQSLNYDRIWDCGVLTYVWKKENLLVS